MFISVLSSSIAKRFSTYQYDPIKQSNMLLPFDCHGLTSSQLSKAFNEIYGHRKTARRPPMNSMKSYGLRWSWKLSGCSSLDALSITSDVLRCIQDVSQVVDLLLSTSSLKSNVSQSIFVHAIS